MRTLREEQDSLFFRLFCCYLFCYKFSFFPCFNALTIAVRSCWGMDVHLFLHHALYALRAILCAASLVGQEMLYRFYMYMCTPAWAVFFFFLACVCVRVCICMRNKKCNTPCLCVHRKSTAWYKPCEDLIFRADLIYPHSSLCQRIDEGKEPANYSQATQCGQYCFEIWSLTR